MAITGGCFCGAIRYAIEDGEHLAANCHCTMCRRTSAAPFVAWLVVPESAFAWTQGAPRELASSEKGRRWFCGECGTPLTCISGNHDGWVDVTIGSLDDAERHPPTFSVYADTALSWAHREAPQWKGD